MSITCHSVADYTRRGDKARGRQSEKTSDYARCQYNKMELTGISTQEVQGPIAAAEPHLRQINGLIERANELRESNPQRSLALAQEALRLAQKVGLLERLLICYVALGVTYSYLSDHEQAIACFLKAVQLSQERDEKIPMFHSLNQVGVNCERLLSTSLFRLSGIAVPAKVHLSSERVCLFNESRNKTMSFGVDAFAGQR